MQIVGYETAPTPALRIADDTTLDRVALDPGTTITYDLGERHCAGTVTESGDHEPCARETSPYCETHTTRWACARCTGDCSMPLPACREEHAVYLAGFAPAVWKVGVTRSWRLETRLREQGADRGAHIRTVETGRRARQIEAGIAQTVSDRVRVPTKIAGLHQQIDQQEWEAFVAPYDPQETFEFSYSLQLDHQPVIETTAVGTVVGTQGRVTVLERGGTNYAVDLRELVGFEITDDVDGVDRQSSLQAF